MRAGKRERIEAREREPFAFDAGFPLDQERFNGDAIASDGVLERAEAGALCRSLAGKVNIRKFPESRVDNVIGTLPNQVAPFVMVDEHM